MLDLDLKGPKHSLQANSHLRSDSRFQISVAAALDRGLMRKINEDNYYRSDRDPDANSAAGRLFLAVDGVGGGGGGNLASLVACEKLPRYFFAPDNINLPLAIRLADAIEQTHHDIVAAGVKSKKFKEMSCTFVAFAELNSEAIIANMGDSRAYCLQDGSIYQITRDHTVAQELLSLGYLELSQASTHHSRHIVTRSLGGHKKDEPEMMQVQLQDGDRYILCSDGLHHVVSDFEIEQVAVQAEHNNQIVKELVETANNLGGPDNIVVMSLAVLAEN